MPLKPEVRKQLEQMSREQLIAEIEVCYDDVRVFLEAPLGVHHQAFWEWARRRAVLIAMNGGDAGRLPEKEDL